MFCLAARRMNFFFRFFLSDALARRRGRLANRIKNRTLGLFSFLRAHILENYNRKYVLTYGGENFTIKYISAFN
jgi:hypothetical protein